jgi:hypothetical protein
VVQAVGCSSPFAHPSEDSVDESSRSWRSSASNKEVVHFQKNLPLRTCRALAEHDGAAAPSTPYFALLTEIQASAGTRSSLVPLVHAWKGGRDGRTAPSGAQRGGPAVGESAQIVAMFTLAILVIYGLIAHGKRALA